MKTPIYDYLQQYSESNPVRAHMPGHKGVDTLLGVEHLDLTEVDGADELYKAEGIIAESERNAGEIFGADTFYSTEGSSLSIRAMMLLAMKWAVRQGRKPYILAGRNAHKTFVNAAAVLDIKTDWLFGRDTDSYEMCSIAPSDVEQFFAGCSEDMRPTAVYITSPDYLGNMVDVRGIAEVAHKYGSLLLVDNAHGAYLKFMPNSEAIWDSSEGAGQGVSGTLHPMDLGADMCADSAHKTLPVITGGAYLHVSKQADPYFKKNAKDALAFWGTTSPSYLIMASLDLANAYMVDLERRLPRFVEKVSQIKTNLTQKGWSFGGSEVIKLTIEPLKYGYTGFEVADILKEKGILVEYRDESHVVLMLSLENTDEDLERIERALAEIPAGAPKTYQTSYKLMTRPRQVMSPREAMLADSVELPAEQCVGRICADPAVSCPPAVPIFMYGERIDRVVAPGTTMRVVVEE